MSIYRFIYYTISCIALFWGELLYSQNSQLRPYTLEDGLPQSQVFDITQDDIGYLWLGTQGGGLCNFDGKKFTVWNENDGLLSNYIHSISFKDDSLFIGTKRGLSIKTSKNKFRNYNSPQINGIYRHKGITILGTQAGLYKFTSKGELEKIKLLPEIDTSRIHDIFFDGKLFWIATHKGLWKLSALKLQTDTIEKYESNNFSSVTGYDGKIFAATFDDGILVIDPNTNSTDDILIREPVRVNHITFLNEELWASTDNEGIIILDPKTYVEKRKIDRKTGITAPNVKKIVTDRQSNIWIATSGGGFYKYFQNNFQHYNKRKGLKGNRIYAVHAIKNNIWISSSEAGLTKINETGIEHIAQEDYFSGVKIKTITSDNKDNIWAGTDGRGILFRETKQIHEIETDSIFIDTIQGYQVKIDTISKTITQNHRINTERGFPSDWIRTLQIGKNNTIWAATYSSGIIKFTYNSELDSLSILKTFGKKNGIEDLQIRDLQFDAQGTIWYASQDGHLGYINNDKVTDLGVVFNENTTINTILFDTNNKMYLGTAGKGIWWADMNTDYTFQKIVGSKHIYSDNIYQLIFDDEENLWVGTERGVDKIIINQSNAIIDVFHFGRNDGFLGIETCLNAVEKDEKGDLWFGAIYGLTKYHSGEIAQSSIKPQIRFEDIQIDYQSLDSINIKKWNRNGSILQLNPRQTQLNFTYRTVDIDHPEAVQYRFRLNNKSWSPWSTQNSTPLAGLAYGNHIFSAQSRNYRWDKSDPIRFHFFIDSPLYKKTWFQWSMLLLISAVIGIIALLYLWSIKQNNQKEQERLQMQNHLLTLEHKALRLQMNPHFIFNVLNGIKAMGNSNPQKMNTTINTFAVLLRETLYNSRKDQITLDQEIKTLKNYIEIEQLMTRKLFTYNITFDSGIDAEEILVPPMLIQPFVENAIRHGILKGNREGHLEILFSTSEEFLHCKIKDNGIGIFQSQKAKKNTDHQSMALTVTSERLTSISGKNALEITEIIGNNETIEGTQIKFKIPLETDY